MGLKYDLDTWQIILDIGTSNASAINWLPITWTPTDGQVMEYVNASNSIAWTSILRWLTLKPLATTWTINIQWLASQTGDILNVKNNAGTVLFAVEADGDTYSPWAWANTTKFGKWSIANGNQSSSFWETATTWSWVASVAVWDRKSTRLNSSH